MQTVACIHGLAINALTFSGLSVFLSLMRFLLNITLPHDEFNAAVKDGSAGKKLKKILEKTKPEAIYFTTRHGKRGAVMIVELEDASQMPAVAEPWFLTFHADVEFHVAMVPGDLEKADIDKLGKKWAGEAVIVPAHGENHRQRPSAPGSGCRGFRELFPR